MECLSVNKEILKTVDEILAQNRAIMQMNQKIIDALCYPPIILTEKEGESFKKPKAGEIIYKKPSEAPTPKGCPYCGAARVGQRNFQWQYACKDKLKCWRRWDKDSSDYLRDKFDISENTK